MVLSVSPDPRLFRPAGFNLGGWLSQSDLTDAHADSFLSATDFRAVAAWGFNSVRLPVDAAWLWEDGGSGALRAERFAFLERALEWAWEAGLHVVLDVHQTPWHSFGNPEAATLWKDPRDLESFAAQWEELAGRLARREGPLWYDLLNEPTAIDSADWNRTAARLRAAVRAGDPRRAVVVESNHWASPSQLPALARHLAGDGTVLSFHFYEPLPFTHQRAPWCRETAGYDEEVPYPGELSRLREYLAGGALSPEARTALARWEGKRLDRECLREALEPAAALARRGVPLYCGEFGAFERCPRAGRLAWIRDALALFSDLPAGWAYWNYKWLDFGLLPRMPDGSTGPLDREILALLQDAARTARP